MHRNVYRSQAGFTRRVIVTAQPEYAPFPRVNKRVRVAFPDSFYQHSITESINTV